MKILKLIEQYIFVILWPCALLLGVYGSIKQMIIFGCILAAYGGYKFGKI